MRNIETKVDGKTLTITVDLSKELGLSKSGKNMLVATSGGNQSVPDAPGLKLGLNIYRPAPGVG